MTRAAGILILGSMSNTPTKRTGANEGSALGPMLSVAEFARITKQSESRVYAEIRAGRLPHVRLGPRRVVIPERDAVLYLERRRVTAEEAAERTAEHLDVYA